MDPVQFVWEVIQSVFSLFMAVALPLAVFWLIARQTRKRHAKKAPPGTTRGASTRRHDGERERLDRS